MSSSQLRQLHEDDVDAVAALFVAAFGEARRLDPEEIRSWLRNDEIEADWFRVLEVDGRVVGYGDIWVEPDVVQLEELVAARGYRYFRSSFTMEIALDASSPVTLPDGIALRTYRDEDEPVLRRGLNEAFDADPFWHTVSPSNFHEFYLGAHGYDPALWLLAWDGTELAGFSLSYPERSGDRALGWIGTLGVRSPWRRRGLGGALLRSSFNALYDHGLRRVGLGVDAENATGALRLYQGAGMGRVRQNDNWDIEL